MKSERIPRREVLSECVPPLCPGTCWARLLTSQDPNFELKPFFFRFAADHGVTGAQYSLAGQRLQTGSRIFKQTADSTTHRSTGVGDLLSLAAARGRACARPEQAVESAQLRLRLRRAAASRSAWDGAASQTASRAARGTRRSFAVAFSSPRA
jgi:hypothetical protein